MWKSCQEVIEYLKKNLGRKIPREKGKALQKHLRECASCQKVYRELYAAYRREQEGSTYKPSEASQFLPLSFPGYKILRKIGHGAMGKVYHALQLSLKRPVAIKVLSEKFVGNTKFVKRFMREARALAEIQHPNVVAVYDMGVSQGVFYYIMEYVEGESLKEYLRRKKKLPPEEAARIVLCVAKALEHAHKHNIVHRDIKPGNILLGRDGSVKLVDLGLAKTHYTSESVSDETAVGTLIGTPHYMAPEQIRSSKDVTIQADIYSLGVTFFQMLTGRLPFQGKTNFEVLTNILHEDAKFLEEEKKEIPLPYRRIVKKMMAKDLKERYASPKELIQDLEELLSQKVTEETFLGSSLLSFERKNSWIWGLSGIALCLIAVLGFIFFGKEEKKEAVSSLQASETKEPLLTFRTTDEFYLWLQNNREKKAWIRFQIPALVVKKEVFRTKEGWRTRLYINHSMGEEAPESDLRLYFPFLLTKEDVQCGDGLALHRGKLSYYKGFRLHPEYREFRSRDFQNLHRYEISFFERKKENVLGRDVVILPSYKMTKLGLQFLPLDKVPGLYDRAFLFGPASRNLLLQISGRVKSWKKRFFLRKGKKFFFLTGVIEKQKEPFKGEYPFVVETFVVPLLEKEKKLAWLDRSQKKGATVVLLGIWRPLGREYFMYWKKLGKKWKGRYVLLVRDLRQPGWDKADETD